MVTFFYLARNSRAVPMATAEPESAPVPTLVPLSKPARRPVGVAILGALDVSEGVLLLIMAVRIFLWGEVDGVPLGDRIILLQVGVLAVWFYPLYIVTGLGVLLLAGGAGIFLGQQWAWNFAVILAAASVLSGLASLFLGAFSEVTTLTLGVFFLWYLFEPASKAFFGKSHVKAFWQKEKTASG